MTFIHEFPFDPTYGCDLEALLQVPAPTEPADFVAFWQKRYNEARAVSPEATLRPAGGNDAVEVFDIEFTSLGGVRIGGWLTRPRNTPVERGMVFGHGYGGRDQPDLSLPVANAAAIFPCLRGQSRSRLPGVPDDGFGHVLQGIESRETYIHGGCAADIWCAASALTALVPEAGQRLDYFGGSFGGGIGALALPWDDRFRAAHLSVPSFGNHPLRVTLPCVGSGSSVSRYYGTHPEVLDVLAYFDAATAARHIKIPVLVAAALFDPAVPPPGQFAVYNAIPDPKELFVLSAGHFPYPTEAAENQRLYQELTRFFAT
jgi:cephalosporin-C deacetylase